MYFLTNKLDIITYFKITTVLTVAKCSLKGRLENIIKYRNFNSK